MSPFALILDKNSQRSTVKGISFVVFTIKISISASVSKSRKVLPEGEKIKFIRKFIINFCVSARKATFKEKENFSDWDECENTYDYTSS